MIIISRAIAQNKTPWAHCINSLENNCRINNKPRLWYNLYKTNSYPVNAYEVNDVLEDVFLKLNKKFIFKTKCRIVIKERLTGQQIIDTHLNPVFNPNYEPFLGDPYINNIIANQEYYFLGYNFFDSENINIEIPNNFPRLFQSWNNPVINSDWYNLLINA